MYRFARLSTKSSSLYWKRSVASTSLVAAGAILHNNQGVGGCPSTIRRGLTSSEPSKKDKDKKPEKPKVFDLTKEWEQATTQGKEYFQKWLDKDKQKSNNNKVTDEKPENNSEPQSPASSNLPDFIQDFLSSGKSGTKGETQSPLSPTNNDESDDTQVSFTSIIKNVTSILLPSTSSLSSDKDTKTDAFQELIEQARTSSSGKGDVRDSTSFAEIISIMEQHFVEIDQTLEDHFGHIDLTGLFPTSMFYYMEHEDEVKNPSWKRRMHRFCAGVDISHVKDLMSALYLAELAYADSVEAIQQGLEQTNHDVELVYCDIESIPNEPAHYILIQKNNDSSSLWNKDVLEVVLVVRGTRSISDAMTDAYIQATNYRDGKAHEGILQSGRYLVGQHTELLQKLCKLAGKKRVKLTLVGHSLGAGAAAIAGMEWNELDMMDVNVIGFGCPSLLSKELAEKVQPFITTVINDSDVIPRMSGATIANKLLDILEYDWIPKARRDLLQALGELQRVAPLVVNESSTKQIMNTVDSWLEQYVQPTIQTPTTDRAPCILYPPGTCIHFYRDGSGITASVTPNTFFSELDISRRMVDDHLIDAGYRRVFLEVMRQYHRNHFFTFEEDKYWK